VLGLVDNVLVAVEPILNPGEFELRASKPDYQGKGRIYLHHGTSIVETGRTFFCMAKEGEVLLNHRVGTFSLGKGAKATFRCVFAGQHIDVEVKRGA
jgi:hypothetical protein